METKKVHIATFGCQMNVDDSERMAAALSEKGYAETDRPQGADLIIINTCSVRAKAEDKACSFLGRLKKLKKADPGLRIALAGCLAQQEGKKLLGRFPHLDLVVGTGAINRIVELIEAGVRRADTGLGLELPRHLPRPQDLPQAPPQVRSQTTIMQGCDNFCSYCVVPYLRGRERSRPPGEILAEVEAKVASGVREVNLLGQNVNSYRHGEWDFVRLLEAVAGLPGLPRLRFTTSHPKDMTPELIAALGRIENLCPYLHLPFQSGSDRILKKMNRGYTREHYLGLVEALRGSRPGLALSSDCIVGFPGETEEDFGETMDLIERVRFQGLFSFRYSDRPGTAAARLKNKVPLEVAARRLNHLQARQREITAAHYAGLVGGEVELLVEGPAKRGGMMTGRTGTNIVVNFRGSGPAPGDLVRVFIERAGTNSLRGRLIDG